MALKSIVAVVFALTLLALVAAQRTNNHYIYFDDVTPGDYQSELLFPSGTQNIFGAVSFQIFSTFGVELCITEGMALQGSYNACPAGMSANFSGSLSASPLGLDTGFSDSLGLSEEDYNDKFGMSDYLATPAPYGNFTTYSLTNGTIYYVNIHSTVSNFNGQNKSSAYVNAIYNQNNCNTGFIGTPTGCVSYTSVNNNQAWQFPLDAAENGQNFTYFTSINVPVAANLFNAAVTVTTSSSLGSTVEAITDFPFVCLRRGSAPACTWIYDNEANPSTWVSVNSFTYSNNITFATPEPGIWFFEFVNTGNFTYQVTISTNVSSCTGGLIGVNCTETPHALNNASLIGPKTSSGPYDYYSVTNNTLLVGVGTKTLKLKAPALLASYLNWPTNLSSTVLAASNNSVNFIYAVTPNGIGGINTTTTWYLSVAAWSGNPYYIWANQACPNNCQVPNKGNSTHGNCTYSSGVCNCDKHYGGLYCYHTGLATVWIVLIVIGCAILLAIAIGVPVALYLRSRQRARYERV